jgi:acetyl esterase/lipase
MGEGPSGGNPEVALANPVSWQDIEKEARMTPPQLPDLVRGAWRGVRMASWESRCFSASVRTVVRRRSWGDEAALAHRARQLFGAPRALQWFGRRGLRVESVAGAVRGEWLSPADPERGVIFYIHGGGYVACSAATHRPITGSLARRARQRVFSLDYRLAPEHRFPAAVEDALAAYCWLLEQGVNSRELCLAGDSAGGGLVLSVLIQARAAGLPLPAGAVCFSPWTDLSASGESWRANAGRCAMFCPENGREFAATYLGSASALDPRASPLFADLGGLPPVLLHVGSTEALLDDARRVHEKLQAADGASRLEIFHDVSHGWQIADPFLPESRASLAQAAAFCVAPKLGR